MPEPDLHQPPTGTVTFLYTDIEESTKRWEQHPDVMKAAVEQHDAIIRQAVDSSGGVVFRTMGDAFCAAFPTALQALEAAVIAQRALFSADWDQRIAPIRVRMALHTGIGEVRDGDYVGLPLNRIARLLSTGSGGQTLLSQAAYDLVRDVLPAGVTIRDLGEQRLKDLQRPEQVYQLVLPDLPADFPPLKALDIRPNNLPIQRGVLIGRVREIDSLVRLLLREDVGLLTLTGPGGIGKTRLALQVAAEIIDHFDDGVFFVSLATISDPELVVSAIAQSLGIREMSGQPILTGLKDQLRGKRLLLVLDNFEHVISASPVIADLLSAAKGLKVLATSREVLHIYGERDFPVPPMQLPERNAGVSLERMSQFEAVRLFIERAMAVRPDFAITNENAPAVAEICYRLDGLPLAIELAAARIAILSPQAIMVRLQSRLKLLTGGARDLPARQQTLRGAIAWSYDLLDLQEQALFRRLCIFPGSYTLEAAEAIAAGNPADPSNSPLPALEIDMLDGIASLAAKSLIRQVDMPEEVVPGGSVPGESRFGLLETIREFGLERLAERGEMEAVQASYVLYFLSLAEKAAPKLMTNTAFRLAALLRRELDNLRGVFTWAFENREGDVALRMVGALNTFWDWVSLFSEGRAWAEETLARFGNEQTASAYPLAVEGAGYLAYLQGDLQVARPRLEQSVAAFRGSNARQHLARALHPLGMAAWGQGDNASALAYLRESTKLLRETNQPWILGLSLFSLGDTLMSVGDDAAARSAYEQSISVFKGQGDALMATFPANSLGRLAWQHGDYSAARSLVEQALAERRTWGPSWSYPLAISLATLAEVARCEGRYDESAALSEESMALYLKLGDLSGIAWCRFNLGYVAYYQDNQARAAQLLKESLRTRMKQGNKEGATMGIAVLACVAASSQPGTAAVLFGAADVRFQSHDARLSPADRRDYEEVRVRVRSRLGDPLFTDQWNRGHAMSMEEAIKYALGEN